MKIAVIQASSQRDKNAVLEKCLRESVPQEEHEIINFGVFPEEKQEFSYLQTAVCSSLLLESGAVDFVVTGCSSGQGMMLALNSLPGVLCGYISDPSEAYLFGRINGGNAVSYPLGLRFGWAAELNLRHTLAALFSEPFGIGYPPEEVARKQRDTARLKELNALTKRGMTEVFRAMDQAFRASVLQRENVRAYILQHGKKEEIRKLMDMA